MAIHPIDFRYGTPEMKAIWEEDFRLRYLFKVEAAFNFKKTVSKELLWINLKCKIA